MAQGIIFYLTIFLNCFQLVPNDSCCKFKIEKATARSFSCMNKPLISIFAFDSYDDNIMVP